MLYIQCMVSFYIPIGLCCSEICILQTRHLHILLMALPSGDAGAITSLISSCCFNYNYLFLPVSRHFSSKPCMLQLLCIIRTSCLALFDYFEQTENEQKHKGTSDEQRKHTHIAHTQSELALKLNKAGKAFISFINTRNTHMLFVEHDIFFYIEMF